MLSGTGYHHFGIRGDIVLPFVPGDLRSGFIEPVRLACDVNVVAHVSPQSCLSTQKPQDNVFEFGSRSVWRGETVKLETSHIDTPCYKELPPRIEGASLQLRRFFLCGWGL